MSLLTPETRQTLTLTDEARAALSAAGLSDPPATLTLTLREATGRERERWEADQAEGGPAWTASAEWATDLLLARAPHGTDRRVVRELVRDMTESEMAAWVMAYVSGTLPDPKPLAQAVSQTRTGLLNRLLGELADAPWPSSAGSTDSGPGTSSG